MGDFPLCLEGDGVWVVIDRFRLEVLVVVASVPQTIAVEVVNEAQIVSAWLHKIEVGLTSLGFDGLDHFVATVEKLH